MNAKDLVNLWGKRARSSEAVHYQIAASYLRRNQLLSFAVIVLTATIGSGIFASLSTTASKQLRLVFGVISVLTAILAGLNRSLRYGERAEENRQAGARWAPIVNSAEQLLLGLESFSPDEAAKHVNELKKQIDDAAQRSPSIPQAFIRRNGIMDGYLWKPERTGWRLWRRSGATPEAAARS